MTRRMSREDEVRRDLERMEREREKLLHGGASRDDDDDDPAVRRGKRIAHMLGPLLVGALLVYIIATYLT